MWYEKEFIILFRKILVYILIIIIYLYSINANKSLKELVKLEIPFEIKEMIEINSENVFDELKSYQIYHSKVIEYYKTVGNRIIDFMFIIIYLFKIERIIIQIKSSQTVRKCMSLE